jgi:hypothetical protein
MIVFQLKEWRRRLVTIGAALATLLFISTAHATAVTYYLSPTGSDSAGDGSAARPWQTIRHATDAVPDNGSTILLKDGVYVGTQSLGRSFTQTCTIKAEHAYGAQLESPADSTRAFNCYSGANARFEGLNIFGSGSTGSEFLVHLSNSTTHNLTFENCFLHDSYNNDIVKINSQAHDITFRRCVLYNQPTNGDEHFDINTVTDVTLEGNIFLNDFAGSGRANQNTTHPYVVIKNSSTSLPNYTKRINVRQNVFVNWQGASDQSYLLLGEDGMPFWEAQDVTIENNLFAFNSQNSMPGALMLKGGLKNITFRSNTIVGHPVGGSAYAVRMNKEGSNGNFQDLYFYNNIWSDPSGGMVDFSDGSKANVNGDLVLRKNLYWNGGNAIPADAGSVFDPDAPGNDDPAGVFADPKLGNPAGMTIPHWDPATGKFLSGTTTIDAEFQRLVNLYAGLSAGSPAIDMADPAHAPTTDILGRLRDSAADIGAFEFQKMFRWIGGSASALTDWGVAANWSNNVVPNGRGTLVVFGNQSAANAVVDLKSTGQTIGSIVFDAGTSTTITSSGGFALTLDNAGGISDIIVEGNHTISAPLIMNNDTVISGSGTVNLPGGISGNHALTILGNATATSIQARSLTIGSTGGAMAVPEPSVLVLAGMAAIGLPVFARRRCRKIK